MAIPALCIGRSGSGKTYSIKGFNDCPEKIGVISVEKGRLPFKSSIKTTRIPKFENSPDIKTSAQISAARYSWLQLIIQKAKTKVIVIDDSQYLLADATDFISSIGTELLHTPWDEISVVFNMPEAEEGE